MLMVNKKIHAIWLGSTMTPLAQVCLDDWRKQGYEFKLWSDRDHLIQEWINECQFAKECYERNLYAFVSDYLRLRILKAFGGLYLDTDVTINKDPFSLFEGCNFSVGYESDGVLGTAIIYAEKDSNILSDLLTFYDREILESDMYMGPDILNYIVNKGARGEVCKKYPVNYFYSYNSDVLDFKKPNDSYLIHWFQHTWKNDKGVVYLKSKNKNWLGRLYIWQKYFFRF